jgi:hypothetical protein
MLGLLTTVTLEVVLFRVYSPFPALLPFFKLTLEVVFCEGIQHRLRLFIDHPICAKITDLQFYLQLGKRESTKGGEESLWSKYFPLRKEVSGGALS